MDWQQAQKELALQLVPLYGERESAVIADWVMEDLSGKKRLDRLFIRAEQLEAPVLTVYERYRDELLAYRPVQYVLHESWFAGRKFYVDESVLIPRPETEELVEWVAAEATAQGRNKDLPGAGPALSILDVGTGSGCIAITLAKQLPAAGVHACDVSKNALAIARRNAETLDAPVHFHEIDFLDSQRWPDLPGIQYLVSNPPYIPLKERETMASHVIGSEPALALFVADNDPLVFYRALSEFALLRLAEGGTVFAEIHEEMGMPVRELFREAGFSEVILKKDLQGKDRMIKATR